MAHEMDAGCRSCFKLEDLVTQVTLFLSDA